jgi:hypothetical protein
MELFRTISFGEVERWGADWAGLWDAAVGCLGWCLVVWFPGRD